MSSLLAGFQDLVIESPHQYAEAPVVTTGVVVVLLVCTWYIYTTIYNLYLSPLSKYPGPKLWAISRIPSQRSVLSGHTHLDITSLHDKYGPVVRIGPNELAFNTAQAFRDIYGPQNGKPFPKDRAHYMPPPNDVDHLLCAIDDSTHARHRKLLAPAFSSRALRDQEPLILKHVDLLITKLREQTASAKSASKGSAKVDIKSWFNFTTFDITGDLMFGESFNCLTDGGMNPWITLIFDSIKALAYMGAVNQFPWLRVLLMSLVPKSVLQKGLDHFNLGAAKVDRRLEMQTDRPDFFTAMLKNGLSEKSEGEGEVGEDRVMSRAELHSDAYIVIIAGSETTATLLSGSLYHLLKNPKDLTQLATEIRNTFQKDEDITITSSANLTFLNAVIEESLRMYPPFVTSLARVPPSTGAFVDGNWVPKDTTIACHHYASYHSKSNFHRPDEFLPERWLEGSGNSEFDGDNKDVLQPFSLGPRGCLGKQLGYAEIRLILCKFLYNFDVHLSPESEGWIKQEVYFLWDKPTLWVELRERER